MSYIYLYIYIYIYTYTYARKPKRLQRRQNTDVLAKPEVTQLFVQQPVQTSIKAPPTACITGSL